MTAKRAGTLGEMMYFIERFTLNRAWNGLTDGLILNEVSHHATQIGVLRDFYQVRAAI